MPRAFVTRRVKFNASHRYSRADWSAEHNESVFGSIARAGDHSHDYVCELNLSGEMDGVTGFIVDLDELDLILADEVTGRFHKRSINDDLPEFADGRLVPSGENLARFIFVRISTRLPRQVRLESVTIAEDETLSATYKGEA